MVPLDALALARALLFASSDTPHPDAPPLDALFLYSRSAGDDEGLFELAAALARHGRVGHIVINGADGRAAGGTRPGEAWPGRDAYLGRLEGLGVPPGRVVAAAPSTHTREENTAYVQLSRERGWRSGAGLTQPHQALRAALGLLQASRHASHAMRLYSLVPSATDWVRAVPGSQGRLHQPRHLHISEELQRIVRYAADLASLEEYAAYVLVERPLV